MTDEQLVADVAAGDRAAVDELYRRYAKGLHVFFSRVMKSSNPEDLVHDVFVRVIEKAHQFNPGKASFRTWVFQIARNHSINRYRRGRIVQFTSLERNIGPLGRDGPELRLADVLADPGRGPEESGLVLAVRDCLDGLKEEAERQALVLYHILGKNYKEIGGIFGKSISAVRKSVLAAGDKVRRCLEKKGVDSFA